MPDDIAAAAAAATTAPAAAASAADPATAAATAPAAQAPTAAAPAPKRYEAGEYTPEERQWLAARGLEHDDTPAILRNLVRGHRMAEQRLGKPAETLVEAPGKDKPLGEWLRANAERFGLPKEEAGYTIEKPKDFPTDMEWNAGLADAVRKVAFEEGLPPKAVQRLTEVYAADVKAMADRIDAEAATAKKALMAELEREVGSGNVEATLAAARQGYEAIGALAGLPADAMSALRGALSRDLGDAAVIKVGAAIARAMGDDRAVGLGKGGSLTMTPADAKAELAKFTAPGSDYFKAVQEGNSAEIARLKPEFLRLSKIAAAG